MNTLCTNAQARLALVGAVLNTYMSTTMKRIIIVTAWASAVIGWVLYQRSTGLGTIGSLQSFIDIARGAWWAILAFVLVYSIRPLVLFPATLLTIAGGLLFGPVVGVIATIIGANASAMVAYWVARSLGFEPNEDPENAGLMRRWSAKMREESFVTVLLMRFAFLPYDFVNYAAGFLRIKPLSFLLATALGSLPGTVSFVLAGASITSLEDGPSGIDTNVLIASGAIFVISIIISRIVKSRGAGSSTADTVVELETAEDEDAKTLVNVA